MNRWHALEGAPSPFGATWIEAEQAYNLRFTPSTPAASYCFFTAKTSSSIRSIPNRMVYPANKTGRIWHCRIPVSAAAGAKFYAYIIEGPFEPSAGHRFDPKKVLLDPYGKVVCFPKDFSRDAASRSGSNAGRARLGLLPAPDRGLDWTGDGQTRAHPRHSHL